MLDLGIVRFEGVAGALELMGLICALMLGLAIGGSRKGR